MDTNSVISINFGRSDIESMAETAGVSVDTAMERVDGWAKHIADQAVQNINEQLMSVVEHDQP